ncbi:MAG TPA: hypothetical protein VGB77_07235, partial [Abditibacteriaceae bacterium]
ARKFNTNSGLCLAGDEAPQIEDIEAVAQRIARRGQARIGIAAGLYAIRESMALLNGDPMPPELSELFAELCDVQEEMWGLLVYRDVAQRNDEA